MLYHYDNCGHYDKHNYDIINDIITTITVNNDDDNDTVHRKINLAVIFTAVHAMTSYDDNDRVHCDIGRTKVIFNH